MMSSFCKRHLCLSHSDSDLLNEVSVTFTFDHFTTSLHELQVASPAPLPVPGSSSHKSSATQCYLCMWCFSVYLSLAPAATRTELPSATCVCGVSAFTCPWLHQPQEQSYPVLPVYVVFQHLPVPGSSSHKSSATCVCGELPSATCVCGELPSATCCEVCISGLDWCCHTKQLGIANTKHLACIRCVGVALQHKNPHPQLVSKLNEITYTSCACRRQILNRTPRPVAAAS